MNVTQPNIDLRGVSYRDGGKTIIDDVSIDFAQGRLAIIGRNGSGKTTLARLLVGLIAPSAGTVRIAGVDVHKDRKTALHTVGMLFQNPDHQIIFPTVIEEIVFGLKQQGNTQKQAKEIAEQTLAAFGKSHWRDASIHTLSQGQRHLVCLMAVQAMRPKLWVLDEPFAGLDMVTKMQVQRHWQQISASIVHITHHPEDLGEADQVLWLEQGRQQAFGTAAQVIPVFIAQMQQWGEADDLADLAG